MIEKVLCFAVNNITILRGFGPFVGKETTSWFDSLSRTASLKAWVSSPDITLDLVLIDADFTIPDRF